MGPHILAVLEQGERGRLATGLPSLPLGRPLGGKEEGNGAPGPNNPTMATFPGGKGQQQFL